MRRFDNDMAISVDEWFFLLGKGSPQQKDDTFLLIVDDPDDLIGKDFPSAVAVRTSLVRLNGEHRVQ